MVIQRLQEYFGALQQAQAEITSPSTCRLRQCFFRIQWPAETWPVADRPGRDHPAPRWRSQPGSHLLRTGPAAGRPATSHRRYRQQKTRQNTAHGIALPTPGRFQPAGHGWTALSLRAVCTRAMNRWKWIRSLSFPGRLSKNRSISQVLPRPTPPHRYRPVTGLRCLPRILPTSRKPGGRSVLSRDDPAPQWPCAVQGQLYSHRR